MNATCVFTSVMTREDGSIFFATSSVYTTMEEFIRVAKENRLHYSSSHSENGWVFANEYLSGILVFSEQPTREPNSLWELDTVAKGKNRVSIKMLTCPYPEGEAVVSEEDNW
jgi:hypothetical protein